MAAARRLQAWWREVRGEARPVTGIEEGWVGRRARQLGPIEGHVVFLQRAFRATHSLRAGCWGGGRLRLPWLLFRTWGRRDRPARCRHGRNLAGEDEFAKQRSLSDEMLDWYSTYVALLRRLESGETPFCLQNFCGGGGSSEGCRRAGGASHGMDLYDQPEYRRRFGDEAFTQTDGMSWSRVKALRDAKRAFAMIGGPPCKFYSRLRVRGEATQPPLIDGFRDQCRALFGSNGWWAIENVMGAAPHMAGSSTVLDGAYFGLRVARARLYETNFDLHIDSCVRGPADVLAGRCCLGRRRRFRKFDEFGRPEKCACCQGNIFGVQGSVPWRCTTAECAHAMGVDSGHMSYERLAQSVPPAYGQLVFAQMCMQQAHRKFGAPIITFDELKARPSWARRTMAFWLRGAGGSEANTGQLFAPQRVRQDARVAATSEDLGGAFLREGEFRELFYSHAGGYDQQLVTPELEGRLGRVSQGISLMDPLSADVWVGRNTYVELGAASEARALTLAKEAADAIALVGAGSRATFVVSLGAAARMRGWGYLPLPCVIGGEGSDRLHGVGLAAMHVGRRAGVVNESRLDHDDVRHEMDWRDRGGHEADADAKAQLTWSDFPHDPERYRGKGLPPWVEAMMTEGATIDSDAQVMGREVEQYSWPDGRALVEAILETDRHIAIGALEYVPDDEIAVVRDSCVVHPLLLVAQGKGKFRACHDYSVGTNRVATSAPFGLPTVWDARAVMKPGSYMCKYDLRDGFFAIPVHPGSRNKLVVRHPASGRLLRCRRLPFGYVDSPRLFCGLTEAIADEVRRRTRGRGIHVFVFVDDFLIVGDDKEAARLGGEVLEQVLFEFGIPWAPHKQRGPSRCMEFLGLLLSNVPGNRCVALTEKRQAKLRAQIDEWRAREPSRVGSGDGELVVGVKELASFLGHLVFCSQVVPQGRCYMQAMLAQFSGLEVDWRRGEVRPTRGGGWAKGVKIREGFWRDLAWWHERFERRNCTPMDVPARGEVAICGTDASDWGTGQLMWDSGQRAEVALEFTEAERSRSINWRELLGIVRVLECFGEELRGRAVLIEGDNTASLAAAVNESSKAEGSQELVRRLVEAIERYELTVRFTHTPGIKLDRPDQTSRGDPVEEPRARVCLSEYSLLERRFGPFTEWVGAERRHVAGVSAVDGGSEVGAKLWVHPAHATVGSALRRLGERLGDRGGDRASGVVIVPHDESAKWWPLVKHFRIVGRWPAGSRHLELNRLGGWEAARSERASLILSFPRSAGALVRPVLQREGDDVEGYVASEEAGGRRYLPLPRGSFLYKVSDRPDAGGELLVVWRSFDPASNGVNEFDGEEPTIQMAELLLVSDTASGGASYALDKRGPGVGSFANKNYGAWPVHARALYDVGPLVKYLGHPDEGKMRGEKMTWPAVRDMVVVFDWVAAESAIRELGGPPRALGGAGTSEGLASALAPGEGPGGAESALAEARLSAEEAAAARVRVAARPADGGKKAVVTNDRDGGGVLRCKYADMTCEGCYGLIGWGKPMLPGGRGMVHAHGDCQQVADQRLASFVQAGKAREMVPSDLGTGSLKRHAQTYHRLSDERVDRVLQCLEGCCPECDEPQMMCLRGCGRGVHGLKCCSFSAGVIQLKNLTCAHCRAGELLEASCTPTRKMVRRMVESMLVEATTGKANTHKGYSDLASLMRKWQLDLVEGDELAARDVRLPHTSSEGTYSFVLWLSKDGGRARSMGTTLRQLGAYCSKQSVPNHATSPRVKALLKELEAKGAAMTTPDTQVTSMMIVEMYGPGGTIAESCSKKPEMAEVMTGRETVLNDFELVGGMRVSEVCGAGEGHGMLAANACIQTVESGPGSEFGETIEAKVEDSKTGYSRWTVFVGETEKTHIKTADHLREWWRISGFKVKKVVKGGFTEERPDYWVVRVSLLGMNDDTFERFLHEIEWATSTVIMAHRKCTLKYAKDRRRFKTIGEDMRYVNVAGGERKGNEIAEAMAWLSQKGFGRYADPVLGPLIRATFGHSLSHMPYSPTSTHVHLVPAMKLAFKRVQDKGVVDPEYDPTSDPVPKFANHSNRRHADRVAMRNAKETGVTEKDINFFFGWELKKMSETMRLHYAGLDRLLRLGLSLVTCKM